VVRSKIRGRLVLRKLRDWKKPTRISDMRPVSRMPGPPPPPPPYAKIPGTGCHKVAKEGQIAYLATC
jgi:hypothetical protein